ncbi:hypothetical protein HAX54_008891 [Datura stramonium]|uniref:Uncharacterized protein n=1 Tax=Datura stramonium TaxID=4076 RepID=A0ABS8TFS0_DATST|nr:hypothetical protein [Datura stramonium]
MLQGILLNIDGRECEGLEEVSHKAWPAYLQNLGNKEVNCGSPAKYRCPTVKWEENKPPVFGTTIRKYPLSIAVQAQTQEKWSIIMDARFEIDTFKADFPDIYDQF